MALVTRTIAVRARVEARSDPSAQRLFDPIVDDLLQGGPVARERFPVRWGDEPALRALGEAKRSPLDSALAESLLEYHRRLGASPASLASLGRLTRGEALCTVAGQQPSPLGGPLYSLHKTASAVALAEVFAERTGMPCVPLYWMHGEDSDFAEIRSVTCADSALALHDLTLPEGFHPAGGLVGNIPVAPLEQLGAEALARWAGLPGAAAAADLWRSSLARARDLGEAYSALMLALFAEQGLVVVDPRLPAFRAAARPVIERYLTRAETIGNAVRGAGEWLERETGRRPLTDAALDSFVFALVDGTRRKIMPDEARTWSGALSPSVALRPVVQDAVFPTVAMACGPGEIAYLAQLREVFEGVGVRAACPVPRFGATWLPPVAVELIEASGGTAWEVVNATDAVLRRLAEREVPADVRGELERARRTAGEALERFAEAARTVDPSLPQMVESARGKVDYQFARLAEGLEGKMRQRLERRRPEWVRLRYFLLPGDKLQERRLSALEPTVWRGPGAIGEVVEMATAHARQLVDGVHEHYLVEL